MASAPLYLEALRGLEVREGRGLDFDKSFQIIKKSAEERRFLSYIDLAHAGGADWNQVHYSIGAHLWGLAKFFAHRNGWPTLNAVVVNKPNVESGKMEMETLRGFVSAAQELGYPIRDEEALLREQQARVFEWAASTD